VRYMSLNWLAGQTGKKGKKKGEPPSRTGWLDRLNVKSKSVAMLSLPASLAHWRLADLIGSGKSASSSSSPQDTCTTTRKRAARTRALSTCAAAQCAWIQTIP